MKRERALYLREARPCAAEVLDLYLALLDVWEAGATPASVSQAVEQSGPELLAKALREMDFDAVLQKQTDLSPAERFLQRACRAPSLEGVPPREGLLPREGLPPLDGVPSRERPRDARHCPECGGLPQLSIRPLGDDPLSRGQRQLMCSACETCWNYSASSCPGCGETAGSQRTFYADADDKESALRVEACATCHQYLIDIELARDPRAVPQVDELTAIPLDLFAAEQGLSKITPNLMGF